MDMGRIIREARKRARINQGKAAEACGVSQSAVSHWEKGDTLPALKKIPVLAGVLGITEQTLIEAMRDDGVADGVTPATGVGDAGGGAAGGAATASPYLRSLEYIALSAQPIPDAPAYRRDVATVPLISAGEALVGCSVEVPLSVLRDHPHAHAIVVEGNYMDRVAGDGAIVVFDPDVEPSNGRIAVVETQDRQVVVRRWYKGVNKLLLAADSHERFEDIVIDNDRLPRVLGVAVHIVIPPSML